MDFARRRLFYRNQELQLAWEGLPGTSGFFNALRHPDHPPREALTEAGHFLGGALLSEGFRIFKNGGLPLLERRPGPLIEEIVLRSSPFLSGEPFLPVRVFLHLSHVGLQDVRIRYWKPASRAPSGLVGIDLGQLEIPPCWVIWNVGLDYDVLVELVDWVRRLALPWFNLFEDSEQLRARLFQQTVSGLNLDRCLELVLAQYGPKEAIRFLAECVIPDQSVGPKLQEASHRIRNAAGVGCIGTDTVWNLATIASAYRLL